jgi:hypothetical protein
VGAEPVHTDEPDDSDRQDRADRAQGRMLANGHSAGTSTGSYQPPAIYTAPVVAEYQRPAPQLPRVTARDERTRDERTREERSREDRGVRESVNGEAQPGRPDIYAGPGAVSPPAPPRTRQERPDRSDRQEWPDRSDRQERPEQDGLSGTEVTQAPSGQLRRLPPRPSSPGSMGPLGSPTPSGAHAVQGSSRSSPYTGPQPVATSPPPGYQSAGAGMGVSLAEAVQAAHEEGQEFGASVARDAPALWLEAVLARKPRMPSDLEARLLQGSALPIDFLLHDEVRHALRRGFWDALERTRR